MSDGLWYVCDSEPGPDEVRVEVRCKKCQRHWLSVIGTKDGTARRVVGYSERTVSPYPGGSVGFNRKAYERGRASGVGAPVSGVRVTTGGGPKTGEVELIPGVKTPLYAYQRLTVDCHRKCGRREVVRESTLVELFAEAVRMNRDTEWI